MHEERGDKRAEAPLPARFRPFLLAETSIRSQRLPTMIPSLGPLKTLRLSLRKSCLPRKGHRLLPGRPCLARAVEAEVPARGQAQTPASL